MCVCVYDHTVHPEQQNAGDQCQPEMFPEGRWLLHPSWHLCIYKRMFESENKILTKEGVTHFLELYDTKGLPFSPEFSEVTAMCPSLVPRVQRRGRRPFVAFM